MNMQSIVSTAGTILVPYKKLWTTAVVALMGDIVTTFVGIELLGIPEGNPLMIALIDSIGLLPMLFVSKGIVIMTAVLMAEKTSNWTWIYPSITAIVYSGVTAHNLSLIIPAAA